MTKLANIAFYEFFDLPDPVSHQAPLKQFCVKRGIFGTILLAHEGINLMLSGEPAAIDALWADLRQRFPITGKQYKTSWSETHPFTRMLVKVKKQILACSDETIKPHRKTGKYLTPKEFKAWLEKNPDTPILDTRNDYEVSVGTFKNAVDLKLDYFRNFPEKLRTLPSEWKKKPVLTFCTGGIRCEKATAVMLNEGFEDVYQLDGGILKYLEEEGGAHWEGNCFVFDWREALDPNLQATPRSTAPDAPSAENFGRHRKVATGE